MEKQTSSKFVTTFLKVIRVLFYLIGTFSIPFYFFNLIGLTIGLIYIIIFKNKWRYNGFILALGIGFSTFFAQMGGVELTRMYPLYFVVTFGWGIMGVYFLIRLINQIIEKYHPRTKSHVKLEKFITALRKPSKKVNLTIIFGLILVPATLWSWVSIDFLVMFDNSPRLLWIHNPSTVSINTDFEIAVQCWDRFERLSAQYDGTVEFSIESYNSTDFTSLSAPLSELPLEYTFTGRFWPSDKAYSLENGKDNGQHLFTAKIATEGIHYIKVSDSFTQNTYYSNPILVGNHSNQIYWGDIHTHSILSDGSGTAEHAYDYARHVAHIEYYALTDHGEILTINKNSLLKYKSATDAAYDPGKFVNFYGMEWTQHKTGHYSCIFDKPILPTAPILTYYEMQTPNDLWDALDNFTASTGARALALPHHTVKASFMQDWSYLNPKYVKIAEVTSNHGDNLYDHHHPLSYRGVHGPPSEPTNGSSITDAIRMGHRISLYASSDSHDGHPGHTIAHTNAFKAIQRPLTFWWTRQDKPYPGGLIAVYSDSLTRETIFTQLENRFIFANSDHGRPILNFTINGVGIGNNSTLQVPHSLVPREINITIMQDGSPASDKLTAASVYPNWIPNWNADIEVLKNGELLHTFHTTSPLSYFTYNDTTEVAGASYGSESCVYRDGKYYLNDYSDNPIEDPNSLNTGGADFYLIRVVGENNRHSYIGPIWVEVSP
ncbi:MAG: DUF3604 domain-containing protein [Promethearchaeota archaeon]